MSITVKRLSVDALAQSVYMAPSYLSHVFKKETGQNISKFIKTVSYGEGKRDVGKIPITKL